MAFDPKYFSPAGGNSARGAAPGQWTYKTTDAAATVRVAGYFAAVANLLELGDAIRVVQVNSLTAPTSVTAVTNHTVLNKTAGTPSAIDISDGVAESLTDTD
jgi:hypothetical protein